MAYLIDTSSGKLIQAYNVDRRERSETTNRNLLLSTLLSLRFVSLPDKERKRIGPRPAIGQQEWRPLWQPPLFFEGKKVAGARFAAWHTRWPHDDSPLADKEIAIYLPSERGPYPRYFPYWIEVITAAGKAHIRTVDTGKQISSLAALPPSFSLSYQQPHNDRCPRGNP